MQFLIKIKNIREKPNCVGCAIYNVHRKISGLSFRFKPLGRINNILIKKIANY